MIRNDVFAPFCARITLAFACFLGCNDFAQAASMGNMPANSILYLGNSITLHGICYHRSEVAMAQITDGTSNTYLVGEKYMNADHYVDGISGGDDWGMYAGEQEDVVRLVAYPDSAQPSGYTYYPPQQDQAGVDSYTNHFGSAHVGGVNMAFCDGSVKTISYSIDPETHRRLGNREDGLTIDGGKY